MTVRESGKVYLYDTTLRDGSQGRGINFSLSDKVKITHLLDGFKIDYIEGGWPGSNPKDSQYFQEISGSALSHSKVVAFGSTCRVGAHPARDANLQAMRDAVTPAVAIFGKSWTLHVTEVLGTTLEENLRLIHDSVAWMKELGREVVYDAEHFFDGFHANPEYALKTLEAAAGAGADWIVLCDTNGGSIPGTVSSVIESVRKSCNVPLGIHTHNDGDLAVANAIAAVQAGCAQVQGTINGYGERCGNANLISIIPTLQLKLGMECLPRERLCELTDIARKVSDYANMLLAPQAPYVGISAFAHKGGVHVSAVEKVASSYEHVEPETVGNARDILISELSGRGNIRVRSREMGIVVNGNEKQVVQDIKRLEAEGFQFEGAEGSVELMLRRGQSGYLKPFEIVDMMVVSEKRKGELLSAEAIVKVRVGEDLLHTAAEGSGPVEALDRALRKALSPHYPLLSEVRLVDYKVRILDPHSATGATTRVVIEAARGSSSWCTVGCSANIIEASAHALVESLELFLARESAGMLSGTGGVEL